MVARIDRRQFLGGAAAGAVLALARTSAALQAGWAPTDVHKTLQTRLADPYCAEAPLPRLVGSWLTPLDAFFVLDRSAEPALDADHRIEVVGEVRRPLSIRVGDLLGGFPTVEVPATIACAGNRRREHSALRRVADPLQWGAGAIGTARWGGARLVDVLEAAGLRGGARHVWFEGADRAGFGGSIPLEVALRRDAPVVLAATMNGAALPRAHGFPVRAVVPGFVGARSVKWLRRIVVSVRTSDNPHFTHAHRVGGAPIYTAPINAAIGAAVRAGDAIDVAGYAMPTGHPDARIERVEVSFDRGATWTVADLGAEAAPCCWQLWTLRTRLPVAARSITARAYDSSGAAQPPRAPWNPGGYLYDGWYELPLPARERELQPRAPISRSGTR